MRKSLKKNWPLGLLAIGLFALVAICSSLTPARADGPGPVCYVTQELRGADGTTAYCARLQPFEDLPSLRVHVVNDDAGRLLGVEVEQIETE